ncbi:MAG: hypothetical protein J6A28_02275 [Clostridia bacterium]|nr:hypothetical protein [Clostridia bacterium]
MNPIQQNSKDVNSYFMDWKKMYPKAYDKNKVSPYTKTRVILMNGTEFESNWFLHQFARNCNNPNLKREIAVVRAQEQQQQKRISCLKPLNEGILEATIAYEQLAIDLTATLAKHEKDKNVKAALDFALLEDFDHLYRFANLLKMDQGIDADMMVGKFTEIMPARPTIAHHRYPMDNVKLNIDNRTADAFTKLVTATITAAEQQTMNYYMNVAQLYKNNLGRKLFAEIGMVEEEHVTQYESLKDPNATWLEQWVMHEYAECYLYYSMALDESDEYIKKIWEDHFEMEVAHLKKAVECLEKYENKEYTDVCPEPNFPKPLRLGENKEYIRKVLEKTVNYTGDREGYTPLSKLPSEADFFKFQQIVNRDEKNVASHLVICKAIQKLGKDYRYQDAPNPIDCLNDRKKDNTSVGRVV